MITTLIDGAAGILLGCLFPMAGYAVVRLIRASGRFAVTTWREITPEPQDFDLVAASLVRRPRREGMS